MNRDYVIVSHEHAYGGSALVFWGSKTPDDSRRSYGGYTKDINSCEKYTREELEKYRGESMEAYPFFDEIDKKHFVKYDEVLMTLDDIKSLGYKEVTMLIK